MEDYISNNNYFNIGYSSTSKKVLGLIYNLLHYNIDYNFVQMSAV